MTSTHTSMRVALLSVSLVMLALLSGCDTNVTVNLAPKYPARSLVQTFDLSAQQGLRDLTSDFSPRAPGADTGIALLVGEKVEILAAGSATIQPGSNPLGPDGTPACQLAAMPEPTLPCNSVIYSVGINGRAGEVGKHVGFNPDATGNLFLGMNTFHLTSNSGSFHITVVVVPPGAFTGLWQAPDTGFNAQGTSLTISAYAFGQNVAIAQVQFTIAAAGQAPVSICQGANIGGDLYSCNWNMILNGKQFPNGPVTLGFTINGQKQGGGGTLAPAINPNSVRAGRITYEQTQQSTNYAGFAATDPSGQLTYQQVSGSWTIPTVTCSPGENSASAIWVGMTSRNETDKSLLAQLGTDSDCQNGTPFYYLWWETFPNPSMFINRILPGDTATASVTFKQGAFTLSISVPGEGDQFSTTQPGQLSDTGLAECIVEAPFLVQNPATGQGHIIQLADFNQVSVLCQINNNEPIADGPQDFIYQMQTDNGDAKATTSLLNDAGTMFTVMWNHG